MTVHCRIFIGSSFLLKVQGYVFYTQHDELYMQMHYIAFLSITYEVLLQLWEVSLDFVRETDMRTRIIGVCSCMNTFDFYFGIRLGKLILRHK